MNEDEVNALAESGAVTYPGSASFFPAPWLADTILSSGTSDFTKLIPAVNAAAIEFNAEFRNDENYLTSAIDHAADFILWAWGVGHGRVTATKMSFDPKDIELEQF